jgi:alcohol dehydrogenase class IV
MSAPLRRADAFEFCSPVRLRFGEGLIDRLGEMAGRAGSVVLVTGRRSARRSGLLDRATKALGARRVTVFDQVEPNPSIETVERGSAAAGDAAADLVVGLGGGSAMDAAKVIAALAANSGQFRREFGRETFDRPPIRTLAVPTTCGTGSEANQYAIITDTDAGDKVNFSNRQTFPSDGLLDPLVLEAIDRDILVATALDAFTHALEGYTSRRSQPAADVLAVEAMGRILRHLPDAAAGDRDAKANLLYASALAGIVIAHTGTTVLHAVGYYLTLRHAVPHGLANAVCLPLLLEHLRDHAPRKIGTVLGLLPAGGRDPVGLERLLGELGIDTRLAAHGVEPGELDAWADYVMTKRNTAATVGEISKDLLLGLMRKHL